MREYPTLSGPPDPHAPGRADGAHRLANTFTYEERQLLSVLYPGPESR
jgi:hypothetical protein